MNKSNDRVRGLIFILLMLGVMAAAVVLVIGVAWFLRPDPIFLRVGMVQDFPAQPAPHYVELSRIHLFVFADGETFQVLDATVPDTRRGKDLVWDEESALFIDPATGARFRKDGTPADSPEAAAMKGYITYVQDGELWIDMRQEVNQWP